MFEKFLSIWFVCGAFAAAMNIIHWAINGALVHADEERFYYLKNLLSSTVMTFLLGPVVPCSQLIYGMRVLPYKE